MVGGAPGYGTGYGDAHIQGEVGRWWATARDHSGTRKRGLVGGLVEGEVLGCFIVHDLDKGFFLCYSPSSGRVCIFGI